MEKGEKEAGHCSAPAPLQSHRAYSLSHSHTTKNSLSCMNILLRRSALQRSARFPPLRRLFTPPNATPLPAGALARLLEPPLPNVKPTGKALSTAHGTEDNEPSGPEKPKKKSKKEKKKKSAKAASTRPKRQRTTLDAPAGKGHTTLEATKPVEAGQTADSKSTAFVSGWGKDGTRIDYCYRLKTNLP